MQRSSRERDKLLDSLSFGVQISSVDHELIRRSFGKCDVQLSDMIVVISLIAWFVHVETDFGGILSRMKVIRLLPYGS